LKLQILEYRIVQNLDVRHSRIWRLALAMGRAPLRLTPPLYHVLLTLAEGPSHGYALIASVGERTDGKVELGPSSLYYALGRLEDAGLIRVCAPEPSGDQPHEEQRRYYELTEVGRRRLRGEIEILSGIVRHARSVGLVSGGRS
jgi:DNA-binding PadR family transcriptional regulator